MFGNQGSHQRVEQRTGTRSDIEDGAGLPVIGICRAPPFVPGRHDYQGRSSRAANATARSGGAYRRSRKHARGARESEGDVQKAAPRPADDQLQARPR